MKQVKGYNNHWYYIEGTKAPSKTVVAISTPRIMASTIYVIWPGNAQPMGLPAVNVSTRTTMPWCVEPVPQTLEEGYAESSLNPHTRDVEEIILPHTDNRETRPQVKNRPMGPVLIWSSTTIVVNVAFQEILALTRVKHIVSSKKQMLSLITYRCKWFVKYM